MDLSKLTDAQLNVALKVISEAERQGVNPNLVLPLVFAESSADPNVKPSSAGAIGVMQLMPSTAKMLNVDPHDMDQNIEGGVRYFKSLLNNEKFKDDPLKAYAAYNAGPGHKFFETGDIADLPDETISYVNKIAPRIADAVPPSTPAESEPLYGETKITEGEPGESEGAARSRRAEAGALAGLVGVGAGANKVPVIRVAQAVNRAISKTPSPAEAAQLAAKVYEGETPGGKWAAKTGYGVGEGTVEETATRYKQRAGHGKITGKQTKMWGVPKEGESAQLSQRLIDRARVAEDMARAEAQMAASQPGALSRTLGRGFGSAPVMGGLGLFGIGAGAEEAYRALQNMDEGRGATLSQATDVALPATQAVASGLSLFPKFAQPASTMVSALEAAKAAKRGDVPGAAIYGTSAIAPVAARYLLGPTLGGPLGVAAGLTAPIIDVARTGYAKVQPESVLWSPSERQLAEAQRAAYVGPRVPSRYQRRSTQMAALDTLPPSE